MTTQEINLQIATRQLESANCTIKNLRQVLVKIAVGLHGFERVVNEPDRVADELTMAQSRALMRLTEPEALELKRTLVGGLT